MKLRKKFKGVFRIVVRIYGSKWGLVLVGSGVRCLKCLDGMGGMGSHWPAERRGWRQGTMRTLVSVVLGMEDILFW